MWLLLLLVLNYEKIKVAVVARLHLMNRKSVLMFRLLRFSADRISKLLFAFYSLKCGVPMSKRKQTASRRDEENYSIKCRTKHNHKNSSLPVPSSQLVAWRKAKITKRTRKLNAGLVFSLFIFAIRLSTVLLSGYESGQSRELDLWLSKNQDRLENSS